MPKFHLDTSLSSVHILINILTQLILVKVSQYFASKKSPTCNPKMNETPKMDLLYFLAIRSTLEKKKKFQISKRDKHLHIFNFKYEVLILFFILFVAEYNSLPLNFKLHSKPQDRKNHLINISIIKHQTLTVNVNNCNVISPVSK